MVAMVAVPLAHDPPVVASLNVVVSPWHTLAVPVITAGSGLTTNGSITMHPVGKV
jgi:hypothetical protein